MATDRFEHEFIETDKNGQIDDRYCPWPIIEIAANALGKEGWELVGVVARQDKTGYQYVFKRPLQT